MYQSVTTIALQDDDVDRRRVVGHANSVALRTMLTVVKADDGRKAPREDAETRQRRQLV